MQEFSALIRRVDEDRWLASRFAPADARARLMALYAVNYEIAHGIEAAREPGLAVIRLQWWRDALENADPGHPALNALRATAPGFAERLAPLAEARVRELEPAPFESWGALEAYLDATAGLLVTLGCQACRAEPDPGWARAAGRAWGLTGLLRAAGHWRARGRSFLPAGAGPDELRARALAEHARARAAAGSAPAAGFAGYGYLALVPSYLRALDRGEIHTPLLARQARLVWACATGRL